MVIDMENGAWSIEIDGLPNFNMVIFHGAMLNNEGKYRIQYGFLMIFVG